MRTLHLLFLAGLLALAACDSKPAPAPENPFSKIQRPTQGNNLPPVSDASIQGLHQNIFSKSCATPGCHDGHFEPDFRTIQSSYSTLVYAPLVKIDPSGRIKYRVQPGDTGLSMLHQRVCRTEGIFDRMPLYSALLPDTDLNNIRRWILDGAPDQYGRPSTQADRLPSVAGLAAFVPLFSNYRVDTLRDTSNNRRNYFSSPFGMPNNAQVDVWFLIDDDKCLPPDYTGNKLKLSLDPYNFSGATVIQAQYVPSGMFIPNFYGMGPRTLFWKAVVNTTPYPLNVPVFMRYEVGDGVHAPAEMPYNESSDKVKLFSSFVVFKVQ